MKKKFLPIALKRRKKIHPMALKKKIIMIKYIQ